MIEQFYKDNYSILVKRIQARRMQECDAEDVVQESFVRALKYKDSFNPYIHEIGAWFNTIMNNAFKDYRHANYTGDYSFCEDIEEDHELDHVEQTWVDADMLKKIRGEVEKLPKGQASIVHLVLLSGYAYKEAAQVLDEKFETVKKTIYRFKQTMRGKYE